LAHSAKLQEEFPKVAKIDEKVFHLTFALLPELRQALSSRRMAQFISDIWLFWTVICKMCHFCAKGILKSPFIQ